MAKSTNNPIPSTGAKGHSPTSYPDQLRMHPVREKNWPSYCTPSSPSVKNHLIAPPPIVDTLSPTPSKMATLKKVLIPKSSSKEKSTPANTPNPPPLLPPSAHPKRNPENLNGRGARSQIQLNLFQ